ncbi:MAG: hypothetical protein DRP78_02175 [Candidatus Omnitrophota bacterium]|nr:MAG: hypothetical protein DRP78_02175 [Candidatus Omnitrophota bacterium]
MNNKFLSKMFLLFAVFIIAGCATVGNGVNRLSINMHKNEVRALLGNNFVAKASKVDTEGNVLDLWEFTNETTHTTYQIFFLNDKVSQWGTREDLKKFPELHSPAYD